MTAPGIGITLYAGNGPKAALKESRELLAELQPAIVCIHTWPDPTDVPLLSELRSLLPGVRLWISPGANGLAAKSADENLAQGKQWANWCADNGVEMLLLNIERPSGPGLPGWVHDETAARNGLILPLSKLLDGCSSRQTAGVSVGITSHDWPLTHPLPSIAYTHPGVSLVLPQVYPAIGTAAEKLCSRKTAAGRLAATVGQWMRGGAIRDDLRPPYTRWGIYGQLWGHQPAATAWLADQADVYLGWAAPLTPHGRAQPEGLRGLRLAIECRRRYGAGKGAILRAQRALGLVADGLPGPATASALGLPW